MRGIFAAILAVGALLAPATAFAHHAGAQYDDTNIQFMSGTVSRFDAGETAADNAWLYVTLFAADGSERDWLLLLAPPPEMNVPRAAPDAWETGDQVAVRFAPLRDGRPSGALEGAITNGTEIYGDVRGLDLPADAPAAD